MKTITEAATVTMMNLHNLRFRLKPTLVAIVGFLGVVLVLVAVLSIRQGFSAVLRGSGSADVAIVHKHNFGGLTRADLHIIAQAPGVQFAHGKPVVVGNFAPTISIPIGARGQPRDVTLRGVGPHAPLIWPKLHIIKGRMFRAGVNEVIVGREAARSFPDLRIGQSFEWNHHRWNVVGIFSSGHDIHESEIWTDVRAVQDAARANNNFSLAYVRLTSPAVFDRFEKAVEHDPRLQVSADRESTHFRNLAGGLTTLITVVGGIIAVLMGGGAMFGALNTMYNAVASRSREIATLRALGFGRFPIVLSVLIEALILGLAGGALGAILAYLAFNGYQASTSAGGSTVAFNFAVTPQLMAAGVAYALALGFIGGLFPAVRAARLPIVTALRDA